MTKSKAARSKHRAAAVEPSSTLGGGQGVGGALLASARPYRRAYGLSRTITVSPESCLKPAVTWRAAPATPCVLRLSSRGPPSEWHTDCCRLPHAHATSGTL